MRDLGKGVVEPEVQRVWSRESRRSCKRKSGEQRANVIPIREFPV